MFSGCEKEAPMEAVGSDPELTIHYIPDVVQKESSNPVLFMARVSDPQGLANLSEVMLTIRQNGNAGFTENMRDDGLEGDILAGDGVFTYSIVPRSTSLMVGQVAASFSAVDQDGNQSEDIEEALTVVDGGGGSGPEISAIILADSLEITEDSLMTILVTVDDPDGDNESIELKVYSSFSTAPIFSDTLFSEGGSGNYELMFNTALFSEIRSDYFFRLRAFDTMGNSSLPFVSKVYVERLTANDPPEIVEVSAPDTLSRTAGSFLVEVEVSDPQGLNDIDRVILNSFLPDGTPAAQNPFPLRDDAIGGDMVPNDGVYTIRFVGLETAPLGTYRFEIYAIDKSAAQSDQALHFLTVIP